MKNLANFFLLKVIKNSWIYMKIIPQNLQIVFWLEKWQNFANEITLIVSRFKDMVHSSWPSGGWVLRGHIGISLSLRLEILKRMIPTSCKATHDNYLKRTEMMKKVLNILFPPTPLQRKIWKQSKVPKKIPKKLPFFQIFHVSIKFP
jgi:hypothetical protein